MTTYILHGGVSSDDSIDNEKYFMRCSEAVSKDEVKILMCNWARPKERWEEIYKRDGGRLKNFSKKKVEVDLLTSKLEFEDKFSEYDLLYINAGWGKFVIPFYDDLKQITESFEGKVIVGTSVGAFLISSHFVASLDDEGQDMKKVHKGFGLLPINVLCHWDIETMKEQKLEALKKESDLPILTLEEHQSVVIYD